MPLLAAGCPAHERTLGYPNDPGKKIIEEETKKDTSLAGRAYIE